MEFQLLIALDNKYIFFCLDKEKVVEKLIEAGADVDSVDFDGNTPLLIGFFNRSHRS